ncbi:MAG: DEAD/DEAH box helicase [bacterium]|nr:DEAD/DEAH box helicase [bacterium]
MDQHHAMPEQPAQAGSGFHGLGIAPSLLHALQRLKLTIPTPIQMKAIPSAIEGKDLIGIAQTGTGKTLAFGIPMLQRLAGLKGKGLIVLPTRELALQVEEALRSLTQGTNVKTAVLIGGSGMRPQVEALRRQPRIVVATPGRLLDHLEHRTIDLSDVEILVLDEADRMLDMGFAPQINRILAVVPVKRQTMLFSATMPDDIVRIATRHMQLPVRVEIARPGTTAEHISHELFFVTREQKVMLLEKILGEHRGPVLVFSRTKHGATKVCRAVHVMGHAAAEIHANRSLNQRREALDGFKSGKYRVLVATDIAARGIDVRGIELVVNFDLPQDPGDYVHRIGRTGRAGLTGKAIAFATPDQRSDVRDIERLVRFVLPVRQLPTDLPPSRGIAVADDDRPRRYGGRTFGPPRRGFGAGGPPRRGGSRGPSRGPGGPSSARPKFSYRPHTPPPRRP